tara:strand:- start:313 stop:576 length:264 start_codon:yes stop_codon:yes gene_type:complete
VRKKIYHAVVRYKWRIINLVKGIEKPSKVWKESKYETCIKTKSVDELNKDVNFISKLSKAGKSTKVIEVIVIDIVDPKFLCMSHDVY